MNKTTTNPKHLYSKITIARKYLHYLLFSSNSKGHGVHSPFVFDFIVKILNDKTVHSEFDSIESLRAALLKNKNQIEVEDFGAGSGVIKTNTRRIDRIAASSLKPKKMARLLYRMVAYYRPSTIIEIGTSFGITTAYLAAANPRCRVITHEGASQIAAIAADNFRQLGLSSITLKQGEFSETLSGTLAGLNSVDFAFIDGNHRKEPTLSYAELILSRCHDQSVLVFDDIHWSEGMEQAWEEIEAHPMVTLSIDLFFLGIIFLRKDIKVPQHVTIRF